MKTPNKFVPSIQRLPVCDPKADAAFALRMLLLGSEPSAGMGFTTKLFQEVTNE